MTTITIRRPDHIMDWIDTDASTNPPALIGNELELDPATGEIVRHRVHSIDGLSFAEYYGTVQRFGLEPWVNPYALLDMLNGDAAHALIERIRAGYATRWDGSNTVGTYTDDALDALDALAALIDQTPLITEDGWCGEAGDWLLDASAEDYGITAETSDDRLAEIADAIERDAKSDYYAYILDSVQDHLARWRSTLRDAAALSA